jgi:hypothetical protein
MNLARSLATLAASGVAMGCQPYRACEPVDEAALSELPSRLSQTGLYAPGPAETLAPGVLAFRPRFELWSDDADKRRWIWLPPGTQIDTSDQDSWQFPVGTKLWKEFTRDGARVETRLLQRLPNGWIGLAYLWQSGDTDATAVPYGALDARGTAHDVPAANECPACHGGRSSHVLGFSAVQLTQFSETGSPEVDLDLAALSRLELLSHPPATTPRVPGNDTEQAALGYLHANCSHCHNAARPARSGARCFDPELDVDFSLRAAEGLSVSDTNTYRTTQDVIERGRPDDSRLLELVSQRSQFRAMPPLATEQVDRPAVNLLRRWIEEM